jgi:putative YhbY family RNA-binding protein
MAELELTAKERQALKARAHGLKPVVLLGAGGLSASVLREIDRALLAHELIKVKVPGDDRAQREHIFSDIAGSLSAARVQSIGKLLVLFRPAPLDEPAAAAPAVSAWPRRRAGSGITHTKGRPSQPASPPAGKRTTRRAAGRASAPRERRGR